ncbi:MFS transporter [Rhodocaloribacter litoris]|uniref:MFS transporter n=1 Tax=Rhodocaloribacter litoris TaxID=2558931 RepID=UPI0014209611|nr:MFS transporter [Rhodocaloribacter litoris]QXD16542.1 MFS transporter [Rhodocaloribacter litoris]
MRETGTGIRLGLRENWQQFVLLLLVNGFVGVMVGVERSVLSLLAETVFGVASATAALSFLIAFGLTKAVANYVAGDLAQRVGRRRLLLIGWLFALPVPLLLGWAPSWNWVVAANLLLGVNQGLAWSATVIMKIDLVGPRQRGLAMGLNEFAGYLAVALAALGAGYLAAAYGPRSGPVWIGGAAALLGLGFTLFFVRDTGAHVELEHAMVAPAAGGGPEELPSGFRARLWYASWRHRSLFATNQAGFVNNLNDGLAWGLFPLFFALEGLSFREIGWLAALYPAVWGIAQVGTGALSDRTGRRLLIVSGMMLQALGLGLFAWATGFYGWATAAVILGLGTAAVYPTLIAQVSDLVAPRDRAGGVGIYRLWRDLGYVAGGLLAGVLADLLGYRVAIAFVAVLTALSGTVALRYLPARPGARREAGST